MPNCFFVGSLAFLFADFAKLPGIKPVAAAVWALVYFEAPFLAEEMPLEFDAIAARTFTLSSWVEGQILLTLDLEQVFARGLVLFVHALEFKSIKPNAAAATLANIHGDIADLDLGQLV